MSDKAPTALEKIFANNSVREVVVRPNVQRPGEYNAWCNMITGSDPTVYHTKRSGETPDDAVEQLAKDIPWTLGVLTNG